MSVLFGPPPAVVPVLVGPMYALFAILPAIAVAVGRVVWGLLGPRGLWRTAQMLWRQKVGVAIVAAGVVGLVYAWPHLFPPALGMGGGGEAGRWPLFRGGADRRGWQRGAPDPVQGKIRWSFSHGDISTFYSSPALAGNRVYATSALYKAFVDRGSIVCVDADTGKLVWAYDAGKYRATFSSPAVEGNYLVVGEGLHFTYDARVYCLDLDASAKKGRGVKLWEHRTKSHVESSPCIFGDKVVVGAGDDGLYCFALAPDAGGKARIIWHLSGKDYPDCETSPVYHDGRIYWGLGLGGHAIVCVDANTGHEIWKVPTPSPAFGSPTIAGGRLYAGMGFGDMVNSSDRVASMRRAKLEGEGVSKDQIDREVAKIKREGAVWCLDPNDGRVLWKFPVGQVVLGSVAADGNSVFANSRDGKIYKLSTDGNLVRAFDMREPLVTSPAVTDEHVYVVTGSGRVCGLDKDRLVPVWEVMLNNASGLPVLSSPAVGRGHVYVGSNGGGLLCLGRPRMEEGSLWAGALGGTGHSGWADDSLVPGGADFAWSLGAGEANLAAASLLPPAAWLDGAFYVPAGKGLARLWCGKELYAKPTRQWTAPAANPVYLSAAGTDKAIFFVDGKPGDAGRQLHCVDPNTGAPRWARPVAADATGEFLLLGRRLLIAEDRKGLVCLDVSAPAGATEVWKADLGPVVGPPYLEEETVVVAVESPPRLVGLDLAEGKPQWEVATVRPPTTHPVMAANRVWVGDEKGLSGYSLTRKGDVWVVPCGAVRGPLAARGGRLACVAASGELLLVNPNIGEVSARLGRPPGGVPPILTDEAILYLTEDGIRSYNLRTGASAPWAQIDPDLLGRVVSPLIVANSYVVFTTDEEGLVCMKPKK